MTRCEIVTYWWNGFIDLLAEVGPTDYMTHIKNIHEYLTCGKGPSVFYDLFLLSRKLLLPDIWYMLMFIGELGHCFNVLYMLKYKIKNKKIMQNEK